MSAITRGTTNLLDSMGAKHMLMATAGRLVGELRSVLSGYPVIFDGIHQGDGNYLVPGAQFSKARQLATNGTTVTEAPAVGNVAMRADTIYHSWGIDSAAKETDTVRNRMSHFLDQSVAVLLEGIMTKLTAQIGRDPLCRSLAGSYSLANPIAASMRTKTDVDKDVLLGAKGLLGKYKWSQAGRHAYVTDFQENVLLQPANFGSANVMGRSPSPLVSGNLLNPNGGIQTFATPYIHNGKSNRSTGPDPVANETTFELNESPNINTTATTFDIDTISPARVVSADPEVAVEPLHVNDVISFAGSGERMQIIAITWTSATAATITVIRAINNTTAATHSNNVAGGVVDGYLNLFLNRDAVGIIIPPQDPQSGIGGGEKITVVEPRSGLSISLLHEYVANRNYSEQWVVSMNFGAKILEIPQVTGKRFGVWNLPTLV